MARTFKKIYIEITNACNLKCSFCGGSKRPLKIMDTRFFNGILKKIKGKTRHLCLHVMGEPLMHPEIVKIFDLCEEYSFKVNLATNGTMIEKLREIIKKPALRQINFSLHSMENSRDKKNLEKFINPIFELSDEAALAGVLISLRLWNLSEGEKNKNNAVLELIKKRYTGGKAIDNNEKRVNGINLAENIFLNQAEVFEWPAPGSPEIKGPAFCLGLRYQAAILADGTVVPCCLDADGVMGLGNIGEKSFDEIINSKRAKKIYDGFSAKKAVEPLCAGCTYRVRFKRKAMV
ncbi:MAG: radical SAM/SPASM domain-containing protein [Candidatus Goldiibacteriota bacterium]|jgi:radical SAM protein with 4Fe4S-binding SPASM domain